MQVTKINLTPSQIQDVVSKLKLLKETAQMYNVPMYASVVVSNTDEDTKYQRAVNSAQSHAIYLTKDEIRKHMLVANGFDVLPPRNITVLDAENELLTFEGDDHG